jgi:hypothetical protein
MGQRARLSRGAVMTGLLKDDCEVDYAIGEE